MADLQGGVVAGGGGDVRDLPVEDDQAVDGLFHGAYFQVARGQLVQVLREARVVAHGVLVEVAHTAAGRDHRPGVRQPLPHVVGQAVAAGLRGEDFVPGGPGGVPEGRDDALLPFDDGDRGGRLATGDRGQRHEGVDERGRGAEAFEDLLGERLEQACERGRRRNGAHPPLVVRVRVDQAPVDEARRQDEVRPRQAALPQGCRVEAHGRLASSWMLSALFASAVVHMRRPPAGVGMPLDRG
ncbi:hypothetical protein SMICM17S_06962 [Streptomyces microflavus]